MASEREGFWSAYRQVAGQVPARGNLVPDAHLVALVHQHGISTIWTRDRDFRRFDGIQVRDPFAAPGSASGARPDGPGGGA